MPPKTRRPRRKSINYRNIPVSELTDALISSIGFETKYDLEKLLHFRADDIDINAPLNETGETILSIAIAYGDSTKGFRDIQLLLSYGADPNPPVLSWRANPLSQAVAADDFETVELLLEYGADPNFQDRDGDRKTNEYLGRTPLMFASTRDVMKLLLEEGADPYIKDARGKDFFQNLDLDHIYNYMLARTSNDVNLATYAIDSLIRFINLEKAKRNPTRRGLAAPAA